MLTEWKWNILLVPPVVKTVSSATVLQCILVCNLTVWLPVWTASRFCRFNSNFIVWWPKHPINKIYDMYEYRRDPQTGSGVSFVGILLIQVFMLYIAIFHVEYFIGKVYINISINKWVLISICFLYLFIFFFQLLLFWHKEDCRGWRHRPDHIMFPIPSWKTKQQQITCSEGRMWISMELRGNWYTHKH